ncbi:MAG: YARHG domain-containing protein [Eubacterium sp.]|nr:YARHG domain-containing protein [Eubacterium sp.]
MKKKTLFGAMISLLLAAAMVLGACGGGSGGGAAESGGTEAGAEEISVLHPEAPDPATSFTSASETEPSSAESDNPAETDTLYSDAFATYLSILEAHEEEIKGYDWQCGYEDPADQYNKPVAVQNILGDDTPELIFIRKIPGDDSEMPAEVSSLHVFTYTQGRAVCLFSRMWDVQVGGGMEYALLLPEDDEMGRICFYVSSGDERWTDSYEYYGLGDSDILVPYGSFEQISCPDEEGNMVYNFKVDDSPASMSEFNSAKNDLMKRMGKVLQFNTPTWQTDEIKELINTKENCEMSYDEAVFFLLSGMKEDAKASEVFDEYGFVLPDSDKVVYSKDDFKYYTDEELAQARNEIYARHGRKFSNISWAIRFGVFTWYNPEYAPDVFDSMSGVLNDTEKKNIETILAVEAERAGGSSGSSGGSAPITEDFLTFNMKDYTFVCPDFWKDKVTCVAKYDVLYINSNDPPGEEVAVIYVEDASSEYASGDPLYHCVWHGDTSTGKRVEVWAPGYSFIFYSEINDPGACPDYYKTMKDVDEQKLLDLQTGGSQNLYDLRNGVFAPEASGFMKNLLDSAITVK